MRRAAGRWALIGVWMLTADPGAGAEAVARFTVSQVAPGVFAVIAEPGGEAAGGNAGFVVGRDAVLVVDSLATPSAAQQLLEEIRGKTTLPVRWLVDTSPRTDHSGGNPVFASAGAAIVAHEDARSKMQGVRTARSPGAKDEKSPALALPSATYRDSLSLWLGDRRVDVFSRPGHTEGSSLVFVPDVNVLFGGDLLQRGTIPDLAEAKTDEWIRTLDDLARRFPAAIWVPGHGPVSRPLDMRPLRDFLVGLRTAVAGELQQGRSGADLAEALLPQLRAQNRGWSGSERLRENVAHVEAELKGTKASPVAPTP